MVTFRSYIWPTWAMSALTATVSAVCSGSSRSFVAEERPKDQDQRRCVHGSTLVSSTSPPHFKLFDCFMLCSIRPRASSSTSSRNTTSPLRVFMPLTSPKGTCRHLKYTGTKKKLLHLKRQNSTKYIRNTLVEQKRKKSYKEEKRKHHALNQKICCRTSKKKKFNI